MITVVVGKEIEKIKGEFESVINGMNMVGEIPYNVYSELFDAGTECIQKAYELGKSEIEKENGGRPKWHKVADGDLPKACEDGTNTSKHVLVQFKSGNAGVCYYDWDLSGWFANGYPEQLKDILAWCEIPKYTE